MPMRHSLTVRIPISPILMMCLSFQGAIQGKALAQPNIDSSSQTKRNVYSGPIRCENTANIANQTNVSRSDIQDGTNNIVTITADKADFKEDQYLFLEGDIHITNSLYELYGEKASINQSSGDVSLGGDVAIFGPGINFEGDSANVNTEAQTFDIQSASFFVKEKEIRGDANSIKRQDQNTLLIQEGNYTTCLPDNEAWSFSYSNIKLDQAEGVGTATHTRFNIKDVPVLYLPWFSFPIDERRKSGFLYPSIGSSGADGGISFTAPYYFNTAPNYDFTLTPHYVHKRGLHTELESRYLNTYAETQLAVGYLNNDSTFEDDHPGEDGERWGLDFEQEWRFSSATNWRGNVDFSAVSDEDYLQDLNTGLQITPSDHINRSGELSYIDESWQFSALLQSFQTVEPDITAEDRPYQRLPEVHIGRTQPLHLASLSSWASLEMDWQSEFIYFYRDKADLDTDEQSRGSRFRHQPKLSLKTGTSWGYLTPSITLDHTDYWLEDNEDTQISRTLPIYDIEGGLTLERQFSSFKHSIEPRVKYLYAEEVAQGDIPNFDSALPDFSFTRLYANNRFVGGDRVGDANQLVVGVTNRFTDNESARDLAVLSVGQVYFYDPRVVDLDGQGASSRSDSLVATELQIYPLKNLSFELSAQWDERTQETHQGHSALRFHTEDYGTILNLGHRYTSDLLEQFEVSAVTPINEQINLLSQWHYDLVEENTMASLAGLEYRSCCWSAQLLGQRYLNDDEELESSILFQFQLKGIGRFGTRAEEIDRHIPGYLYRDEYEHK